MKMTSAAAANVPLVQIVVSSRSHSSSISRCARLPRRDDSGGIRIVSHCAIAWCFAAAPADRRQPDPAAGLAAAESVFRLIDERPGVRYRNARDRPREGQSRIQSRRVQLSGKRTPGSGSGFLFYRSGRDRCAVGASGAGKSTLANLLPRFYAPDSGQILLDGVDIATLKLGSLRANIALVSQDIVLFNDTVAANIAYGRLAGTSETDIVQAAEAAHAMQFISEMTEGLGTVIGENGVRLSGGQRQRLAIARAFLKNSPVLILDEATSALDSESERHIQEALETLMKGRATLVIAHRLSTYRAGDRIVVLDAAVSPRPEGTPNSSPPPGYTRSSIACSTRGKLRLDGRPACILC